MKIINSLLGLMLFSTLAFSQSVQRFDVVISEIMADPTPQVSLPNAEFIELKNISGQTINLQGWRLSMSTSLSGAFPNYNLPPDSFLILAATSQVANFTQYGKVLGIPSFPSLPNEGGIITLISKEGVTIHSVPYNVEWYRNILKSEGGWTLEMIDTKNPCTGKENWKASIDPSGGTPGKKNSADAVNPDLFSPQLLRIYSIDSITIVAVFNEPVDSASATTVAHYSMSNNISIFSATPQPPLFHSVILKLNTPLQKKQVYELTVNNIKDCKGNVIVAFNKAKAGWAEEALVNDIIINEILFNPKPAAYDYVELYNRSNKIVDASKLFIANRNSSGNISSIKKLSEAPMLIFPGEYKVATENIFSLQQEFFVQDLSAVIPLSLPSYPDDKGTVVILNAQGEVVDELNYSDKWHFALINNKEGVALERIDPDAPTQNADNWHSAASTAGYGTPGYKNSQYKQTASINATISVNPKIFSPDNDGSDDVATINYQLAESGYVANVFIFDANGRRIRHLVKNGTLGLQGSWNWDGLDEKGQKLPIGSYIIYTEIFNLQGKKESFKNVAVLARRLN